MKILTILPVSRLTFLDQVLESLTNQSYKDVLSLLVVVDGDNDLFLRVRNKVTTAMLSDALIVQSDDFRGGATTIPQRRWHISAIHNQIKKLVHEDVDWIFSIEDDGILPVNALSWLVNDALTRENVGMVSGVELGRWGTPYVGAWYADDTVNPKEIKSVPSKVGSPHVDEIDASGLYCALIRADLYRQHNFNADNGLGPDINLGFDIKNCGYKNYIDWSIPVTHLNEKDGAVEQIRADSFSLPVTVTLLENSTDWYMGP